MMAMSLERDVEGTSLPAGTSATATITVLTSEKRPDADGVFRSNDKSDCEPKIPLHSGLSALIQAATSQLGHIDESQEQGQSATNASTRPTSRKSSHNASSASASAPPRYTPHGFHTTPSATMSFQDEPSGFSSSTLNTPTLGPESTSEVRKQTFPEVLMTVLEDKTNADVITFLPDGKFFAVRRKEFSETIMINFFAVATFEDFLKKIHSWGFSRIDRGVTPSECVDRHSPSPAGIEIFRHPMFVKGDWEKCSRLCFGESPTEVRLSALPDRARIEYTLSDESTLGSSKRRLSPSHTRKESESSTTSKQRLSFSGVGSNDGNLLLQFTQGRDIPAITKSESAETTTSSADASTRTQDQGLPSTAAAAAAEASTKMEDAVRSVALAITTEKLNLKTDMEERVVVTQSSPLVEQAVENATHTIVTDAIETLLRDEGHTRETYLKHEHELSRSSLPGVVPISKQLFSPPDASGAVAGTGAIRVQLSLEDYQQPKAARASPDPPAATSDSLVAGIRTRSASATRQRSSGSRGDPPAETSLLTSNNSASAGVVMSTSNTSST